MRDRTLEPRNRRRSAFTLVELLIVIGIIVLIMSIAIPAAMKARKAANRAKVSQDLQAISIGLEEYKNNYGDYPQATQAGYPDGPTALIEALAGTWDNTAKKLVPKKDPKSGRAGLALVQIDKFNVKTDIPSAATPQVWLRDSNDQPYLYFPTPVPQPDVTAANRFVAKYPSGSAPPLYNYQDCPQVSGAFVIKAIGDMQLLLGDANQDGRINGSEVPVTKAPYLLWAAASDALFGFDSSQKTDDVANFDFPAQYRK